VLLLAPGSAPADTLVSGVTSGSNSTFRGHHSQAPTAKSPISDDYTIHDELDYLWLVTLDHPQNVHYVLDSFRMQLDIYEISSFFPTIRCMFVERVGDSIEGLSQGC
jgi:hypothetical protein